MSQPKTRLMQLRRHLVLAAERAAHPGFTTNAAITSVVVTLAAVMLVLGAVINWPYAYYQLLRVASYAEHAPTLRWWRGTWSSMDGQRRLSERPFCSTRL